MTEQTDIADRSVGRRASDHIDMPTMVKHAIKDAIKESLADPEVVKAFWKRGYDEFTGHAGSSASQWVGRRILTAVVTVVFTWTMYYLVKNGAIK